MNNTVQRKKKKKYGKVISLAVMLVIAAALLLVYKILDAQNQPPADTGTEESDVIMLIERDSSEVASLAFSRGETEYAFTCQKSTGAWSWEEDTKFPLNQTPVASMAAAVCQIGAYRELGEDTGVYGFDAPALTVRVSYTDGEEHSYAVGDLNSATGYRYFKDTDTGLVYTISPSLLDYFNYTIEDMLAYDTLPTDIETDYITAVTLTTADTEKAITDPDGIAGLYELFVNLAPTRYADWNTDADEKAAFGIGSLTLKIDYKKSVTITNSDGSTSSARTPASYTVKFGDTTEDGMVYYTVGTSDVVYMAYTEQVDAILEYLNYTPAETSESAE